MKDFKNISHNYVSFRIYDFDVFPDELTARLGVKPTEIRIKGETRLIGQFNQSKIINKENVWILKSELPLTASTEDHINNILSKIESHQNEFANVAKQFYSEFKCALYVYKENSGIHLDEKLLQKVAFLNARIDLDIYNID